MTNEPDKTDEKKDEEPAALSSAPPEEAEQPNDGPKDAPAEE